MRPKDYGDHFARILYDYCLGDGESSSAHGHSVQKKNTSVLTEEALQAGGYEVGGAELSKTYGDKLLRMCKMIPTFA